MRSSSRHPVDGPLAYAPSTHCFVNFCCSAGFLTRDEARDRIHDYRHLFAVHTLRRWYRDGEDLEIGRNGVRAQLEQLAASRVALERAVAEADARAYHESAGVGTTIVRSERDGSLVAAQLAAPAGKNRVRPRRSRLPQRN